MASNQFYEVMYGHDVIDMREIFKQKEDEKFKGKIFCPECARAKVFIRGNKKNKFIVDTEMSIHNKNCSYNYQKINLKQGKKVFNELEKYQISSSLKELFKLRFANQVMVGNIVINLEDEKHPVALPLKNVENIEDKDCKIPLVFFGTCSFELVKNTKGYILKLSATKSGFQYFTVNISPTAFEYFPKSVKTILANPNKVINFMYYGVLNKDKRNWKATTLKNTNCLIIGR